MKIIHVVPCADESNGVYHVARMLAEKQSAEGGDAKVVTAATFLRGNVAGLADCDEVWVHGMWLLREWLVCLKVLKERNGREVSGTKARCRLIRMTHGSLSPIYLEKQGKWKKRLVGPIERWLFTKTDRVVTTGEWETEWCRKWGLGNEFQIEDLRQRFRGNEKCEVRNEKLWNGRALHLLYLGRRHPLKGVKFLERAVREINDEFKMRNGKWGESEIGAENRRSGAVGNPIELREVSDAHGEALEKIWEWCDVLCLPTLSENFGLVVAEALERGKPAITTDGAPAWCCGGVVYLRGYRDGTDETRVKLLKQALMEFVD